MLDTAFKLAQITAIVASVLGLAIALRPIAPFRYWDPFFGHNMYKVHTNNTVCFDDIIGYDDVKKQLRNHIKQLQSQNRNRNNSDGNVLNNLPKGYQFIGPNGVGKTMMAKAIAHECNIPFIELCGENMPQDDVGPLFDKIIKEYPNCIICLDESDKNRWYDDASSVILKKLDGIDSDNFISTNSNFLFITICNNTSANDISLTRSGRIDSIIRFELPNTDHRLAQIKRLFPNLPLKEQEIIANETESLSQADIAKLKRESESAISLDDDPYHESDSSASVNANNINSNLMTIIRNNIKKISEKTSNIMIPKVNQIHKERIAYHELGHLIVAEALNYVENMHIVTIQEGKGFGGYVKSIDNGSVYTEESLFGSITVLLGGTIAEQYFCNSKSTLSSSDYFSISDLLNKAISNRIILSDKLVAYQFDQEPEQYSLNETIDKIMVQLSKTALYIIMLHEPVIKELKDLLIQKTTLYRDDITPVFQKFVGHNITDSVSYSNVVSSNTVNNFL